MTPAQIVDRLLEADPDDVDLRAYVNQLPGKLALYSYTAPGDNFTAPLRVVLTPSHRRGEWVTHLENQQVGGKFYGHYFDDYDEAVKDFKARCLKLRVSTEPRTTEPVN